MTDEQDAWIVIEINHHHDEVTHPFGPFGCPDEAERWVAEEGMRWCRYVIKLLHRPGEPLTTGLRSIARVSQEDPA